MSFEHLSAPLREVMRDAVPTEIQREAIPRILDGKNVLLISPTGSGKTEAALLPVLQMLLDMGQEGKNGIRVLYVTPLRALNRDMLRRMQLLEKQLGFTVGVRHGDTSQSERQKQSKTPPQVLITTPETLQLLLLGRNLRRGLLNVRWVVIDEIHELAEDERGAQLAVALERLEKLTPGSFQRIGLSATVGSPEEFARFLGGVKSEINYELSRSDDNEKDIKINFRPVQIIRPQMSKAMEISVHSSPPTPEEGQEPQYRARNSELLKLCRGLIDSHTSTLFFVNTRDTAEWLAASFRLEDEHYPIGIHHGSLSRDVRIQMEDEFKAGHLKSLICTSSLELGIDVGSADFVIQYNSPRQVTRIVQRVGRAGHSLDRVSEGVILSSNADELLEGAVIARAAAEKRYERTRVRPNPLCVLANQVVAFAMAGMDVPLDDMNSIIRGAYPFRSLRRSTLESVVRQLADIGLIRIETRNDRMYILRGRASLDYFYSNISMIPDEKNYQVRDIATRKVLGTLDESFVATYAESDLTFIFRGTSWRIVEIREGDELLVEQVKDLGALPSWAGEELPVPLEIALEVGRLRRERDFKSYPLSTEASVLCKQYLEKQDGKGENGIGHDEKKSYPIADDRTVVIDCSNDGRLFVINACLGTRVNETLGRYVAAMMSVKFGESVGLECDAYRITVETPVRADPSEIRKILLTTKPEELGGLMRLVLKSTPLLRFQFLQTAKKFGIVKKDADFRAINLVRLMDMYLSTPAYTEAVGRTLWERMDVDGASLILSLLQSGKMSITISNGLSPIGTAGYDTKRELLAHGRPDRAILNALRERLSRTEMVLACLSCGSSIRHRVADIPERVKCISCGGILVAAVHPYERPALAVLKKAILLSQTNTGGAVRLTPARGKRRHVGRMIRVQPDRVATGLTEPEKKNLRRLQKSANLLMSGGRRAAMALAGRGIGPDTAGRIMERLHMSEDELLREILAAEVNYAKTRRFWD